MRIIEELIKKDPAVVHQAFVKLMEDYFEPAFGSMSKRDFDIMLFTKLQELGLVEKNPEIYDIVRDLRVTRTKARNLLYESKLRHSTDSQLDDEMRGLILNPVFLKDDDKIVFEVGNPLLVDHIRSKLRSLGHITDGSFSPELVKLRHEAFSALFIHCLPNESKNTMEEAFIACGTKTNTSLKSLLGAALKKIASKIAGKVGEEALDSLSDYLKPIVEGKLHEITEKYAPYLIIEDNPPEK